MKVHQFQNLTHHVLMENTLQEKLMNNNPSYPNLKTQHIIQDDVGKKAMETLDPIAINFWHFRPDFHPNFETGLIFNGEKKLPSFF